MENDFYKDEFERFLQNQVKNHRMFPSDVVWRGIYKKLHGDTNWPALTIAAIVLLSALIAISIYFTPNPHITPHQIASTEKSLVAVQQNTPAISSEDKDITRVKLHNAVKKTTTLHSNNFLPGQIASHQTLPDVGNSDEEVSNTAEPVTKNDTEISSPVRLPLNTAGEQTFEAEQKQADDFLRQHPAEIPLFTTTRQVSQKHRISYQLYFTPSISYRKLTEDRSAEDNKSPNAGGPVARNYVADVNKIVRHTPGTGVEAGVSFRYNLSERLKLTSGFQFNMRGYYIEAYMAPTEVATIALTGSSGVDSVNTYAVYRTTNGYRSTQLQNRYYQLSIPVGMEWDVIGNKKISFSVAASLQPTYLLNRNAYLISTDFKNYTKSPQMLRNWNLNTNLEASVKFKSGSYNWQFGPQLRYQQFPTFIRQYPIKENLLDYGIKLGISKTIR